MNRVVTAVFTALCAVLLSSAAFAQAKTHPKPNTERKRADEPATAGQADSQPVDLNDATEEQLKVLPGVGDAYAKKIVAGRPYTDMPQLLDNKILPKATYEKVAERIIAKQQQAS